LKVSALRNARKRETRLKGKVENLLDDLRQNRLLTDQASDLLDAYKDIPLHLFRRKEKGQAFTSEQQQFASTLHYYSAAAYAYVRSKIPSLPSPRTIRRRLSVFDGKPGLTEESFSRIKTGNESNQSHYRICAITIDEMEIKKHIDTDKYGKVHGFQDFGCGPLDDDSQPQATKALVVLGVGLNGHWKLPLGYLLTNGASADLQASLLQAVLSKLWESGCIGVSITFDGLAANQKTLTKLGGCLHAENMDSSFPHPCDPEVRVAVLFDACHMLKLARSLLSEYQVLTVDGLTKAKWQHIEKLHDIQQKEGLTLANRLTERHVKYKSQKMKVNLAAQLLSASTASALEYLRSNQYDGFEDSLGTEIFISHIDRLCPICRRNSQP